MKRKENVTSNSLLSRNAKVNGDISGDENIRIEGAIKGTVSVTGDVLVEEAGNVEANINGNNVVVKGSVKGNITANHRIEIYATGIVIGDISAQSVDIQEGAKFEGRSHMVSSKGSGKEMPEETRTYGKGQKENKDTNSKGG